MKRLWFTILAALSLLLCVAVVVMWVRSYSVEESITDSGPRGFWDISVSRGVFHFYREWMPDPNLSYEEHETLNPFGLRHLSEPPSEPVDPFEGETLKGFDLQFWGVATGRMRTSL